MISENRKNRVVLVIVKGEKINIKSRVTLEIPSIIK